MKAQEREMGRECVCARHSVGGTGPCFLHVTWRSCAVRLLPILRVRCTTFVAFPLSPRREDVRE